MDPSLRWGDVKKKTEKTEPNGLRKRERTPGLYARIANARMRTPASEASERRIKALP